MMYDKKVLLMITLLWLATIRTNVIADVSLADDCYLGNNVITSSLNASFFKPSTSGDCLCMSNSSREVRWFTSDGKNIQQQSNAQNSTLSYLVYPNETYRRYICAEMENGSSIHNVSFDVNLLYIPERPVLTIIPSKNICPLSSLLVLCQATTYQTQIPMFSIYTYKSSQEIITEKTPGIKVEDNGQSVKWSYNISYIPGTGGALKVQCRVTNIYFNDLHNEQQINFDVEEPPLDNPTIIVDGTTYKHGDRLPVQEGTTFNAKCLVNGGNPPVSSVTLSCGTTGNIFYTNSEPGTEVLLPPVSMTKSLAGQQCTCTAQHTSGCYDLKTVVTLGATYPPEVTLLTVNDHNTSVTVGMGESLHFICKAIGNPTPTLYVAHESPTLVPFVTIQALVLDNTVQAAECSDTDVFYCVANNGINTGTQSSKQKSIQVYVKCTPEVTEKTSVYTIKLGTTAEIRIPITAYPNPTVFALSIKADKFSKPVDSAKYNVTFTAGVAPKGTVTVYLFSTKSEDLTDYILDIDNGVDRGYNYEFSLQEKKESLLLEAIVGIAVGAAAVVIIAIIVIVVICKKKTKTTKFPEQTPKTDPYNTLYYTPKEDNLAYNQVGGYFVPTKPDNEYVPVEDHYDYIPADSVYSEGFKSVDPNDSDAYISAETISTDLSYLSNDSIFPGNYNTPVRRY